MSTEPAESRPTTNPRGAADRQRLIWQVGLALVVVGILVFNAWSEARKARVQEEEKIAAAEHKAAEKARKAEEKAEAARRKDEAGTKSRSTPAKVDAPKSRGSKSKKPADESNVVTASPEKPVDDAPVAEAPPKPRDNPAGSEVAAKPSEPRGPPTTGSAKSAPTPPKAPPSTSTAPKSGGTPKTKADPPTLFRNVTLKNQDGRVIYWGDIDVAPTLARIDRGDVLSQYRNDGITFQNREGRLPKKPSGHYREWVHPTPGVGGPGPQRIVTGKSGEAYYTHDHYDTFRKIR